MEDITQEKRNLHAINQEYLSKMKEYDTYYDQHSKLSQELQLKHQALDAFKETVVVFQEQMELHKRYHKDAQVHELQK